MDCRTCWKTVPKCTLTFVIVSSIVSLALCISCLAVVGSFLCYYMGYLSMIPYQIFERGQVWRLLSCYLINPSFWSMIFIALSIFFTGIQFEAMKGTAKYILIIVIALLLNSLLSCVFMAFFGKIPGINSVDYFARQWTNDACLGQTPLVLLLTIYQLRAQKTKTVNCCCFLMPTWAYMIILYVGCQLMMYPPWYGLFYNLSAVIIGYATPSKLLTPRPEFEAAQGAQYQVVGAQPAPEPEAPKFTVLNQNQSPQNSTVKQGNNLQKKKDDKWGKAHKF